MIYFVCFNYWFFFVMFRFKRKKYIVFLRKCFVFDFLYFVMCFLFFVFIFRKCIMFFEVFYLGSKESGFCFG